MSLKKFKVYLSCLLFMATHINAQSNLNTMSTTRGGNTVLTVGTDIDCDYSTIQSAIDAAPATGSTEIRITNQQVWTEQLSIVNKSALSLRGRYQNCLTIGINHSVIKGSGSISAAPAIAIANSVQISLYGLDVKDAAYSGGITIENSQVNLDYIFLKNNNHRTLINGATGGGLYTNNSDVGVFNSFIFTNKAARGGGIGCLGGHLEVNNTRIGYNTAYSNNDDGVGGGIYASSGCLLELNNFATIISYEDNNSIHNNSADHRGGGLFATGSATVNINDPNNPNFLFNKPKITAFLNNNILGVADSGGGGIAASGAGTEITAYHLNLGDNEILSNVNSVGGGAALLIQDQATFSMKVWQADNNCDIDVIPDPRTNRMCNQIYNHQAFNGNKGGVAYLTGNAQADIYQTFITENMATIGHLAYINGATLRMQGNIITQNGNTFFGGGELIYAQSGGSFISDFNTFTNNRLGSGLGVAYVISTSQAGTISVARSVIDEAPETDLFLNSIDTNSAFKCLLTHEDDSFFGTDITLGSPQFQNSWPFHLTASSPGVDLCQSSGGSLSIEKDIDGEVRGFCRGLSCVVNPQRYDAGADEYTGDDLIFKNGFAPIL